MSENLASYYELRLKKYLTRVLNGSASRKPSQCIEKILELYTNVLKARNIHPLEWSKLVSNSRSSSSSLMQLIQQDHLLDVIKQALSVTCPDQPAFDILKNGLENYPSKVSEQQRANASHPHKVSSYKELLKKIISTNISITEKELLKELRKFEGGDVITALDFDQEIIRSYDARGEEHSYSMKGLKDHLRKIRDKMI